MGNQGLNNVRTQLQKRKQIILRKSGKSTLLHATVFKNWWYSERAQSTYLVCAGNGSRKNVILKATISVKNVMVHYCEYHSGILREEIKYWKKSEIEAENKNLPAWQLQISDWNPVLFCSWCFHSTAQWQTCYQFQFQVIKMASQSVQVQKTSPKLSPDQNIQ